ncbi:MAG: hypothetical protein V1867_03405 [Candidatus Falkowbacteria bacterium]
MKYKILFILVFGFILSFQASADSAPSVKPGADIKSLKDSNIQMKEEMVTIDIKENKELEKNNGSLNRYYAHVKAEFIFINEGDKKTIDVGFPLDDLDTLHLGDLMSPDNFRVYIDGQEATTTAVKLNENSHGDDWIAWKNPFNKGENKTIVEYDIEAHYPGGYTGSTYDHALFYVLETGAGWNGLIEKADITINFPDDFNLEKYAEYGFFPSEQPAYAIIDIFPRNYKIVSKNQIKISFNDFDPVHNDNIRIYFSGAEKYNNLISALDDYNKNYNQLDSDQYINLGKAYLAFSSCKMKGGNEYAGQFSEIAFNYLSRFYGISDFEKKINTGLEIISLMTNKGNCIDEDRAVNYLKYILNNKLDDLPEETKIKIDELRKKYLIEEIDNEEFTANSITEEIGVGTNNSKDATASENSLFPNEAGRDNQCAKTKISVFAGFSYLLNGLLIIIFTVFLLRSKKKIKTTL